MAQHAPTKSALCIAVREQERAAKAAGKNGL
jgi:hypothetical protein